MAGSVKADLAGRDIRRGFSVPGIDLKIALLILIPIWLISLPVYFFFRSPSIRGINALIDETSKQRPIEPRLSGGFQAGIFIDGDSGGNDNNRLDYARDLIFEAVSEAKDPLAQLALGKLRLIEGKTDEAMKPLRDALAAMPGSAEAHNDMGACLLIQDKFEEALDQFESALKLNPKMREARYNRALCYERLLLRSEAASEYTALGATERDRGWKSETRQRVEKIYFKPKPSKEIINSFDTAIENNSIDEARKIVKENLEVAIRYANREYIIDYLNKAVSGNTEKAERTMSKIELIGKILTETNGDKTISDLAVYLRDLPESDRPDELNLVTQIFEAERAFYTRKYSDVLPKFEQLEKSFAFRGNYNFQIYAANYSANCYYILNLFNSCAQKVKEGLEVTRKHSWPSREAGLYSSLGLSSSRLGLDSRCIKYCNLALQRGKGLPLYEAKTLQVIGNAYWRLGDFDNALQTLRQSTNRYLTNRPETRELANNYINIADIYRLGGNHQLALLYARESLAYANQAKDYGLGVQASSFIAVEQAHFGRFDEAENNLNLALNYLKMSEVREGSYIEQLIYARTAEVLIRQNDIPGAIEYYSKAKAVAEKAEDKLIPIIKILRGRAEAYILAKEYDKANEDLLSAVKEAESYRSNIEGSKNRSDFLDAVHSIFDQLIHLNAGVLGLKQDAFNYIEQSRARALLDELSFNNAEGDNAPKADQTSDGASVREPETPLKLSEAQAELPPDITLLLYSVTNQGTYLFLVAQDEFKVVKLPVTTETLTPLAHNYLSEIKNNGPLDEITEKARNLYDMLIKPAETLIRDKKKLCIVPDKALHFLPFAALVDGSGRYLIESHKLMHAPSASVLVRCLKEGRDKPETSNEKLIAVGNPDFNRVEYEGLPDLIDSQDEVEAAANLYIDPVILTRASATKNRLIEALKDCEVAHIATHCLVEEKSPWLAKLLLASTDKQHAANDGILYLNEVYKFKLPRTRLVVLAACQTAMGQYYRGEGMVSMVRPFLALRVPTVVASLWSVDSQATGKLMVEFHRARKVGGQGTSESLRSAQIKMARNSEYKSPYYWAPFIAVGSDN